VIQIFVDLDYMIFVRACDVRVVCVVVRVVCIVVRVVCVVVRVDVRVVCVVVLVHFLKGKKQL